MIFRPLMHDPAAPPGVGAGIIEGVRSPQEIKREKRRKRLMGEG
jgi:hypothetical protein